MPKKESILLEQVSVEHRYVQSEVSVKVEQAVGKTIRLLFENDIEESLMISDPDRLSDRFYI